MSPTTSLPQLEQTIDATTRYLAVLSGFTDADCRAPTILPGWTRGHVITHLCRNADGMRNLLDSARTGANISMYTSNEDRAADIEAGAGRSAADLLEDATSSAARWLESAQALPADRLAAPVTRTPGAPPFPAARVGGMRRTELEVHHADLLAGYTPQDWPADFTEFLLKQRCRELTGMGTELTLRRTDTGEAVAIGAGGVEVSGHPADLVWWLIGRGTGADLSVADGELPEIGTWR